MYVDDVRGGNTNLWDTGDPKLQTGETAGLDLADFSAAALRFRSETRDMSSFDSFAPKVQDALAGLIEEENALGDGDDFKIPEWADYDDDELKIADGLSVPGDFVQGKRSEPFKSEDTSGKPEHGAFASVNINSILHNSVQNAHNFLHPDARHTGVQYGNSFNDFSSSAQKRNVDVQGNDGSEIYSYNSSQFTGSENVSVIVTPKTEPSWLYLDPQQVVQGPFATAEMRNWLEFGYFKINLPVKLETWSRFHALGVVYPTPESAFLHSPLEPSTISAEKKVLNVPPAPMIPQHVMSESLKNIETISMQPHVYPSVNVPVQNSLQYAVRQDTNVGITDKTIRNVDVSLPVAKQTPTNSQNVPSDSRQSKSHESSTAQPSRVHLLVSSSIFLVTLLSPLFLSQISILTPCPSSSDISFNKASVGKQCSGCHPRTRLGKFETNSNGGNEC